MKVRHILFLAPAGSKPVTVRVPHSSAFGFHRISFNKHIIAGMYIDTTFIALTSLQYLIPRVYSYY